MLFIKNLTKLGGSEIKINLAKEDGLSTIALTIGNDEPVNLLSSSVEEIYPSFKKSIDIGLDSVELDVWLTKDMIPVVIHGGEYGEIEEFTDGKGNVKEMTLN